MSKPYYTPIDFPEIVPDNWEVFWKIWNEKADQLVKTKKMHPEDLSPQVINDSNVWKGFLMYDPDVDLPKNSFTMPIVDIRSELPNMFNQLTCLKPYFKTFSVLIIESLRDVISHSDTKTDQWMVRYFLHNPSPTVQWYFTKPQERDGQRTYITSPPNTKWFAFNDAVAWHGSDWNQNYPKILIKIYGEPHDYVIKENLEKYKEYGLSTDN